MKGLHRQEPRPGHRQRRVRPRAPLPARPRPVVQGLRRPPALHPAPT
ncbi:hypothetical protein ACRAWD_03360 [Caulobacter segnis]